MYVNLARLGAVDPEMGRLKGLYRKTWFQNELAFPRLMEALLALRDAATTTVVLKGAALTDLYYRDRGARPMQDMDILVPPGQWAEAGEVLRKLEWQSLASPRFKGLPRFKSDWPFKHRDGFRLDLHCHVIEYFLPPRHEPSGLPASLNVIAATVAGASTHVLDHPDQLMHVCLHGARSFPIGNVVWVADAMKILDRAPTLDWERLVRLAAGVRCARAMGEALKYLSDRFQAPVPPGVVASLRSGDISRREALGFWSTSRLDRGPRTTDRMVRGMGRYLRMTAAWNIRQAVRGIPRYLQEIENLDRPGQIPLALLRRALHPGTRLRHPAVTKP